MDRETALFIFALAVFGVAAVASGWWPGRAREAASARLLERSYWFQIWLPLSPAAIGLAALFGWSLRVPDPTEPVPRSILIVAAISSLIIVRALVRAVRAARGPFNDLLASTVGLLHPQVVLSPQLIDSLDRPALAAACQHESAHARHQDPLRIWLAQLACDLQWPWPNADQRFRRWQQALELARDEEAREQGAAGGDLAAAIIAAAQLGRQPSVANVANIASPAEALKARIERLLTPLVSCPDRTKRDRVWVALFTVALVASAVCGATVGDTIARGALALVRF